MRNFMTDQEIRVALRMEEWLFLTGWINAHLTRTEGAGHVAVKLIEIIREMYRDGS